jgi:hypothetical protein
VKKNKAHIMDGFPEVIQAITNGNSIVNCNFDIPQFWDMKQIQEQGRAWSLEEWETHWKAARTQLVYSSDSPMPSWLDLRREDIFPE